MLKNCCWQNWLQQSKHQDVDAQSPFSIITFGDFQRSCPSYPMNTMGILKSKHFQGCETSTKILGETCKRRTARKSKKLAKYLDTSLFNIPWKQNDCMILGAIIKSCFQDLEKTALPKCLRPPINPFTVHSNHPKLRSRKSIFQVAESHVFHPPNTTPSFSQETVWFHFDSTACY